MKVPIFTDEVAQSGGWHGEELRQAFLARGYEAVFVSLNACTIDLSTTSPKIQIPEFQSTPKMGFVRGVAAGSLQQVIYRLNILHMLQMMGTQIYNTAKTIEHTVDKSMTSFLLSQYGLATPSTWVCESRQQAHKMIASHLAQSKPIIIKPLFGSQGKGVRLIEGKQLWPLPGDCFVDGVYYLQDYIDTGEVNHDYRAFVVADEVVAVMQRSGCGWLNNVAQGAKCKQVNDHEINVIAVKAAQALQADYCGVDIIRDKYGKLWVLEVNGIPAWQALSRETDVNIAQVLVDDLIAKSTS